MSDMLDKYTIFDNFDKLDLSPVASLFTPSAATETSVIVEQMIDSSKGNFTFSTHNETVLPSLENKGRPISYNSDKMGNEPVPDMFWYITNNRFYIDPNGSVKHTSKLKNSLNALDEEWHLLLCS